MSLCAARLSPRVRPCPRGVRGPCVSASMSPSCGSPMGGGVCGHQVCVSNSCVCPGPGVLVPRLRGCACPGCACPGVHVSGMGCACVRGPWLCIPRGARDQGPVDVPCSCHWSPALPFWVPPIAGSWGTEQSPHRAEARGLGASPAALPGLRGAEAGPGVAAGSAHPTPASPLDAPHPAQAPPRGPAQLALQDPPGASQWCGASPSSCCSGAALALRGKGLVAGGLRGGLLREDARSCPVSDRASASRLPEGPAAGQGVLRLCSEGGATGVAPVRSY